MRETFVDFDICHQKVSLTKLLSVTLTYFLQVKFNGATAEFVLRDFDLLFEGQTLKNFISLKR